MGTVIDGTDQLEIPYVNVVVAGSNRGTFTNDIGEFVLKVDSLPISLVISHVGYDKQEIRISDEQQPIQVLLVPSMLQSVTITSKRANKNKDIIEKALERTRESARKNHYGKAFYRQLSKNDSTYNELYEIFYDTRFNADGINDWAIEQGRYALLEKFKGQRFVFNKNFTLINRIFPIIHPDTKEYLSPVRPDGLYYFDIEMKRSFIQSNDREIAVVGFRPKPNVVKDIPAMTGELYIDLKTYDILKLSGRFENTSLGIISLKGEGEFENYVLHYDIEFKPDEEGDLLIDYIKIKQTADVVYESYPLRKIETNALLSFYEHYKPLDRKRKKLGGRLRFKRSDREKINKLDYDPVFWRENPIVKRTPIEEEVIATFEKDRQFGSIYLNNKNEVAFLPELDKDPVIKELTEKLAKNIPVHEKVYLQVDKPYYGRGETLWFKAYITDAIVHRPYNVSRTMYVELINPLGEEVAHKKLEILGSGFATGDFLIYPGYLSGTYQLRAYTDQMSRYKEGFFFKKEITIHTGLAPGTSISKSADFDLQFFPEGGDLVYGIPSQIAFKAVDEMGQPQAVSGIVYNDLDQEIGTFDTRHEGMGRVVMNPADGRSYYSIVTDGQIEKKIALPKPLDSGYVMTVRNPPGRNLTVRVLCDSSLENSTVYLIGQIRRHIYYKSKGTINNQLLTFEVPKYILPNGILQLTLMDSLHRPYCERLTFIDREDHLQLTINPNKKKYNKRGAVELDFRLRDIFGDPIQAELSMAVTDAGLVQQPRYGQNIKNYLLLSSDLTGTINQPEQYFDLSQPNTLQNLELLMMTNGWRRYNWRQVMVKSSSKLVPRTGYDICGKMRSADFEKYGRTVLTMIPLSGKMGFYTASVDQHGGFCFANVDFRDTSKLAVQAIDDDGAYHEISVTFERSNNIRNTHLEVDYPTPDSSMLVFLNTNETHLQNQLYFDGTSVLLNAVEVKAKKKKPKASRYRTFHHNADMVFDVDENAINLMSAIQNRIPFMRLSNSAAVPTVRFTDTKSEPLILLNGIPLNVQLSANSTSNYAEQDGSQFAYESFSRQWGSGAFEILESIDPAEVDRVEVLKGARASIYGIQGMNGVIAIYTKTTNSRKEPLITQTYEGYYTAREFYVPKYEAKERQDLRSTLFWQASFQTDEQGRAKIAFPNSDIAKSFQVIVEGITAEGQPVHGTLLHNWEKK